jgi:hypothetical protein
MNLIAASGLLLMFAGHTWWLRREAIGVTP